MRSLLFAAAFLVSGAAMATEMLTIAPSTPGWWIEPQPLFFGGPLPLATVARIGCNGFVAGPAPTFIVEHSPQGQMPLGFLEFRISSSEADIEATVAVQMPNGILLCSTADGPSVRVGALPGTYRVWAASRTPFNAPVEGFLEISHVPLQSRR